MVRKGGWRADTRDGTGRIFSLMSEYIETSSDGDSGLMEILEKIWLQEVVRRQRVVQVADLELATFALSDACLKIRNPRLSAALYGGGHRRYDQVIKQFDLRLGRKDEPQRIADRLHVVAMAQAIVRED